MLSVSSLLFLLVGGSLAHQHHGGDQGVLHYHDHFTDQIQLQHTGHSHIPQKTRDHWMRRARQALVEVTGSPCPFAAFGSVIVNHTAQPEGSLGKLICIGANAAGKTGNPLLHGETQAIINCTSVLSAPPHNLSPSEILNAWADLSLYTTAEPCAMCAAAVSWGPFRELIYATDLEHLLAMGWSQIDIKSKDIIAKSPAAGNITIVGEVLQKEMNVLFNWQYESGACPEGCVKSGPNQCVVKT